MQAYKYEDRFLINPGSATGAYSVVNPEAKPSFVLMDIDGAKVRPHAPLLVPQAATDCSFEFSGH